MLTGIQYDYKQFTLSNGASDYDIKENILELFSNVSVAKRVIIWTNKNISFKFNNTNLPAISLSLGDSPFSMPENFLDVTNIFMSNASGSDATVTVWLV